MATDVPDGSIIITPKEFYDGVKSDIADIKQMVSPLPELRARVDKLEIAQAATDRKVIWLAGFAAGIGGGIGTVIARALM